MPQTIDEFVNEHLAKHELKKHMPFLHGLGLIKDGDSVHAQFENTSRGPELKVDVFRTVKALRHVRVSIATGSHIAITPDEY